MRVRRFIVYPVAAYVLFHLGVYAGYEWAVLRGEVHR